MLMLRLLEIRHIHARFEYSFIAFLRACCALMSLAYGAFAAHARECMPGMGPRVSVLSHGVGAGWKLWLQFRGGGGGNTNPTSGKQSSGIRAVICFVSYPNSLDTVFNSFVSTVVFISPSLLCLRILIHLFQSNYYQQLALAITNYYLVFQTTQLLRMHFMQKIEDFRSYDIYVATQGQ